MIILVSRSCGLGCAFVDESVSQDKDPYMPRFRVIDDSFVNAYESVIVHAKNSCL